MARAALANTNFNRGEWGRKMYGRIDLPAYRNACRKMVNALPLIQGGFSSRPGTRYVTGTKNNAVAELLPFEFNNAQTFVIEAGALYFRFFYGPNRGQLVVPTTAAAITNGTFLTDITGWTDSSTGTAAISHDNTNKRLSLTAAASGIAVARQAITVPSGQQHSITLQTFGNPLKIRIGTSAGGTQLVNDYELSPGNHVVSFVSSGTTAYLEFRNEADAALVAQVDNVVMLSGVPLEIVTPYALADCKNIRWAQSADVVYLACAGGYAPQVLKRRSNTSWSMEAFDYQNGPYYGENFDQSVTLTPSSYTGSVTITASKPLFKSTDVGRHLRLSEKEDNGFHSGWGVITAYTSPKAVTMLFKGDLEADEVAETYKWRLGAWGATEGYPSVLCFYEDRLFFANSPNKPQTVWSSTTGAYSDFAPAGVLTTSDGSLLDDVQPQSALTFTISDDQINPIMWMLPAVTLLIGTAAGEFSVAASSLNEGLTPDNVTAKSQSKKGSTQAPAVRVDGRAVYISSTARKAYEMVFDGATTSYQSGDMTLYADHMLAGQARRIAYQKDPRSILWFACIDGTLRSISYVPAQDVLGPSRHVLGGDGAMVKTVCAISGTRQSTLWMITERVIEGSAQRYVEYLDDEFDPDAGDALADACFLDCSAEYSGGLTSTITGLSFLEGQTVGIVGDGKCMGTAVVVSGAISLPYPAQQVQVGLTYTPAVETMPNIFGSQNGPAIGKQQMSPEVYVQFVDTVGGRFGRVSEGVDQFEDLPARSGGDPPDAAPPLFNGLRKIAMPAGHDRELTFEIRQTLPMPLTVTGIFSTAAVADS